MKLEDIRKEIREGIPFDGVKPEVRESVIETLTQLIVRKAFFEDIKKTEIPEDKYSELEALTVTSSFTDDDFEKMFEFLKEYISNIEIVILARASLEINEFIEVSSGKRLMDNIRSGLYSNRSNK